MRGGHKVETNVSHLKYDRLLGGRARYPERPVVGGRYRQCSRCLKVWPY